MLENWQERLSSPPGTSDALVVSLALSALTAVPVLFFVLTSRLQIHNHPHKYLGWESCVKRSGWQTGARLWQSILSKQGQAWLGDRTAVWPLCC